MQADCTADIHLEAIEVLLNHILYVRGIYPSQIFKKRRVYNTPVFVSIFPPLNNYLAGVLKSARELLIRHELQCLALIVYQKENEPLESYQIQTELLGEDGHATAEDPHLIEFEQQLRSAIYKLSERVKPLPKLPPGNCQFKIHLHTTQDAFIRFSHESQYQEFPWLQTQSPGRHSSSQAFSLLPLATVKNVGLKMQAFIFS
ncbi:DNA polymerase zeta processivity subunit [Drosophila ficusphila]|uniref:DNA polymerase zeta processivity subunit n=1 Tax=Drosophila ficusphila TaxID=30025 RepID=UPI0007E61FB8|nr:DNA polymerase zeta processivity subunit [Drosophila ficusphila]